MDDLNIHTISEEETRLLALKNKIKWLTVVTIIVAIAIAGMLIIDFYPDLLRRLLGDQERGDLSTITSTSKTQNVRTVSGNSTSAYLGIEIQDIKESMAKAMNLRADSGVVITSVVPSSPAAIAGLEQGDIIIRVDRTRIDSSRDIQSIIADEDPGEVIKIVVDRDGQLRTFYVKLTARPTIQYQTAAMTASGTTLQTQTMLEWGCTISPLSSELILKLAVPPTIRGVVVVAVAPAGLANNAGIIPGDIITKVNREITQDMASFYRAIYNQNVVVLEIYRANRLIYTEIQTANANPPLATIAGSVIEKPVLQDKIAIATSGTNLDAQLAPFFSKAPFYIIVDLNTNTFYSIQNDSLIGSRGFGIAAVQLVASHGVKASIAANYGPQVFDALVSSNIAVYQAGPAKISDILYQYRSYMLKQITDPAELGFARSIIATGGAPFATEDDEEDEEQSGYKGMPTNIPPQGKYDPEADAALQNTAGSSLYLNQQTQYCYCPQCNIVYEHPAGVPCSSLTCSSCGSRLISLSGVTRQTNIALTSATNLPAIVAVSSTGTDMNSQMAQLFGTAPYYIIVNINTNKFLVIQNQALNDAARSYGTYAAQLLASQGVGAVIAGSYGARAQSVLSSYNLIPFVANIGRVSDVVNLYREGKLNRLSTTTLTPTTSTLPGYSYVQNLVTTGGAPFASTDEDEEEEQSGYKGMPYTIPPQGKYDPELDPANQEQTDSVNQVQTTSGTTLRTDYCYCPYCNITVPHPPGVPCSALTCPICNNRLMNYDASNGTLPGGNSGTIINPQQNQLVVPTTGTTIQTPATYIQVPTLNQLQTNTSAQAQSTAVQTPVYTQVYPGSTYQTQTVISDQYPSYQITPQNQLRLGSTTDTGLNQTTTNYDQLYLNQKLQYCYCPHCNVVYAHPAGIPCSSLTCSACGSRLISLSSGAANYLQIMPGTTYLQTSGQPDTIPPPVGMNAQNTAGTTTIAGQPVAGQIIAGQPIAGQTIAGQPIAGQTTAGQPIAGQTTAGQPIAGQTTAGQPIAGQTIAGQPTALQTTSVVTISGQPDTIPPSMGMGAQTTAGTTTSTGVLQGTIDGNCICPLCKTTVPHEKGTACYTIPCPKCSTLMVREGAVLNQTAVSALNNIIPSAQTIAGQPPTTGTQLSTWVTVAGSPPTMNQTGTTQGNSPQNQGNSPQNQAGSSGQIVTTASDTTGVLQGTIDGNCVCPACNTTVPHIKGTACYTIPCPKCSTLMVREGTVINRLVPQTAAFTIAGALAANQPTNTRQVAQIIPTSGIVDLPALTIASTSSGSVCIATTGSTIESSISDLFDKAPYFLIVGLGQIRAVPNPNANDLIGSGRQSAQLVVSEGAKAVITNDIGVKAIEELIKLNVSVYTGVKGTASQALNWYQDGRLTATSLNSGPVADDEEDHGPPSMSKSKAKGDTSKTL